MSNIKNILLSSAALGSIGLIVWGIFWFQKKSSPHIETYSSVLLERLEKIAKLATVEGNFSELYEQKSFTYFDIAPFQKKVLVRVNATVAAGFDFEGFKIEVDSSKKVIWSNEWPEAKILYIDHKLDYYDISEGIFTSFTEAEYNHIQNQAKEMIRQKANESTLLTQAIAQKKDIKEMIEMVTKASGWEIKYRTRALNN